MFYLRLETKLNKKFQKMFFKWSGLYPLIQSPFFLFVVLSKLILFPFSNVTSQCFARQVMSSLVYLFLESRRRVCSPANCRHSVRDPLEADLPSLPVPGRIQTCARQHSTHSEYFYLALFLFR